MSQKSIKEILNKHTFSSSTAKAAYDRLLISEQTNQLTCSIDEMYKDCTIEQIELDLRLDQFDYDCENMSTLHYNNN
jgi:hypothetical protein